MSATDPTQTSSGRTQAARRQATRAALIEAARPLFATRGYGDVGAEEIVRAAGLTRGALYHHFAGKEGLLEAIFEQVEQELLDRVGAEIARAGATSPLAALQAGIETMLAAAVDPGLAQITLIDAPSVLGWERWREIGWRYGMGLTETVVGAAIDAGELPAVAPRPLAHVLLGALDEAILYVARSEDPALARDEMSEALGALLSGLRADAERA